MKTVLFKKSRHGDPLHRSQFSLAKETTAHFSKSFYLSSLFLPKKERRATYALYAFCRYVDNVTDKKRNRSREERLNELDTILMELTVAYRSGESEHPILNPFVITALDYGIPLTYPVELISGMKMDLTQNRYPTFEELKIFCYRVASVVGLMMTHILGYNDKNAFIHAENLGIAMQLTNILRDIKEDKDNDRIYLPLEDLHRFGVPLEDIYAERLTPALKELLRFQAERALRFYADSKNGILMLEKRNRFPIFAAHHIYKGILTEMERQDYNPFIKRLHVPAWKKVSLLIILALKGLRPLRTPNGI